MFMKAVSVEPLQGLQIKARFANGDVRVYDVSQVFDDLPFFRVLADDAALFRQVHVDSSGYGIVWNDELDLASEEVWTNGKPGIEGEGASRAVV